MVQIERRIAPIPLPRPDFRAEKPVEAPIPLPRPSFPDAEVPTAGEQLNTGTFPTAEGEPVDERVRFGGSAQAGLGDQALAGLQENMVGGKVRASKLEAMQDQIDGLLRDPATRQALIERYDLNSEANQNTLVAVTAIESGPNGDMGEVMTTVLNRALLKNIANELTGDNSRVSLLDVVNEGDQFASKEAVAGMLAGRDTSENHLRDFGPAVRELLPEVLAGETTFTHDASGNYFFNQGGFSAGTDFKIGKHHFSDRYSSGTSMLEGEMHERGKINWSR